MTQGPRSNMEAFLSTLSMAELPLYVYSVLFHKLWNTRQSSSGSQGPSSAHWKEGGLLYTGSTCLPSTLTLLSCFALELRYPLQLRFQTFSWPLPQSDACQWVSCSHDRCKGATSTCLFTHHTCCLFNPEDRIFWICCFRIVHLHPAVSTPCQSQNQFLPELSLHPLIHLPPLPRSSK